MSLTLLTICIKVLPDFQETGRVQVIKLTIHVERREMTSCCQSDRGDTLLGLCSAACALCDLVKPQTTPPLCMSESERAGQRCVRHLVAVLSHCTTDVQLS